MEAWAAFWKIVFFISITAFGLMSVWVIFGGVFDIKRMFAELRRPEDRKHTERD